MLAIGAALIAQAQPPKPADTPREFRTSAPRRWRPTCCTESSAGPSRISSPKTRWPGTGFDFFLIWLFVRTLEKNKIFLRA
jgi:hypothetical protein